jgi:hypothetical protein
MLERLQKRQKESYVVNNIGDIFLECALEFGSDYVKYNGHFPLADNTIKIEKARNPEFKQFLEVNSLIDSVSYYSLYFFDINIAI